MAKNKEKKDTLKEVVDRLWPKTKEEIEKGMISAKKILAKGEKQLKELSEKGASKTKKLSLVLKREKLYFDLGKKIATTSTNKWTTNKRINALMKEIKSLDRQMKKIK